MNPKILTKGVAFFTRQILSILRRVGAPRWLLKEEAKSLKGWLNEEIVHYPQRWKNLERYEAVSRALDRIEQMEIKLHRLEELILLDPLTGLYNRRFFHCKFYEVSSTIYALQKKRPSFKI